MAKVDGDIQSFFMNPHAYTHAKGDLKKSAAPRRSGKTKFSQVFEKARSGSLGPLPDLPVCEETLNFLMDDVRSAGDTLRGRPFPEEILRYKQAVRMFMHYVVENCYALSHETGIPKFLKPGYKGPRGTEESRRQVTYTKIERIDKKLEDMAAMLLAGQMPQLTLAARLEEIKGLLIDLMQ